MVRNFGSLVRIIVGSIKYPTESSQLPPNIISASSELEASSIKSFIESKEFLSITALTKFEKSLGSPIFIVDISFNKFSSISGQIVEGI